MSTPLTSGLAELLDSRADTRDMLSSSPNLAHACLLLGRGEFDLARRELAMGLKDGHEGSKVIGQCISAELLRMDGDVDAAWEAAVACATSNRFHSIAVLYLKMLFPYAKPREVALSEPMAIAVPDPEPTPEPALESPGSEASEPQSMSPSPDQESVVEPTPDTFPDGWERVLQEPCLTALRLGRQENIANHGANLSGLMPLLGWLENDLFPRTMMGKLHHAAFDGSARMLHHWGRDGANLTALIDASPQAAVLAARLGKAFHDLGEDEA